MAKSIQELLHYTSLTKSVLRTSDLHDPFPAEFKTTTEDVVGNSARYRLNFSQRKAARYSAYGSPSRNIELLDVGDATAKLVHIFEGLPLTGQQGPILWNQLQSMDAYTQDTAKSHLRHQIEQAGKRLGNHRLWALARQLRSAVQHYDINGNPLPSSTGAVTTVSNNVAANNQNQLNGIIGASWALNNTNIPLDVIELRNRTKRLSGLPIEMALFGDNLMSYLAQNSYVAEYLARDDTFRGKYINFAGTELPAGFLGIPEWHHVDTFYTDNDGTNQDLWAADAITFCPKPSTGGWYALMQGQYWVPSSIAAFEDGMAAMNSLKPITGMGAFAQVIFDPPGVMHYHFDTLLHVFKTPDAIFQADVVP